MSTTSNPALKTHPVNVTHLVVGLVFLGLAASWVLRAAGLVSSSTDDWLFPAVLVVAGAAGLLTFVTRGRLRRHQPETVAEDERDIADLEAAAFAPYPRDMERTRLLDQHPDAPVGSDTADDTADDTRTTINKEDDR